MYIVVHDDNVIGKFDEYEYEDIIKDLVETVKLSEKYCPLSKGNVKDVEYSIIEEKVSDTLSRSNIIKTEKTYNNFYLYSSFSSSRIVVSVINVYYCYIKDVKELKSDSLYIQIKGKLNEKVIRNMDRDSLVQLVLNFKDSKDVLLMDSLLSRHKKHSYALITEKLKRFGTIFLEKR